jgi:hypothetical protein
MWLDRLNELMLLPRGSQVPALQKMRNARDPQQEQWNSAFGAESLYDAWSQLPFMQNLYEQNRTVISGRLHDRDGWHIVEIGGGNGALWDGYLRTLKQGTLTLIDPNEDAHHTLAAKVPSNVAFRSIVAGAENADIPPADIVVCSLALHHIAGIDAAQRHTFGLNGDGKVEVLRRVVAAVKPRAGTAVLNEADIYNENDLPPGDPVLVDHFIDVYVRRAARAIAYAITRSDGDAQLQRSWDVILRQWCLDQVDNAYLPRNQRDVYELDAARWIGLLHRAGAEHVTHRYTDEWNLFQQYVVS